MLRRLGECHEGCISEHHHLARDLMGDGDLGLSKWRGAPSWVAFLWFPLYTKQGTLKHPNLGCAMWINTEGVYPNVSTCESCCLRANQPA